MDPFDCGDEPDVGGLIGPGVIWSCEIGKSSDVNDGDIDSFLIDTVFRFVAFFGKTSVVVETMLLLLLIFFTLLTLRAGDIGDIGGDALLVGDGHEPRKAG